MFRYMIAGGSMAAYLEGLLLSLPVVLLALSLHEAAHGYAAYYLGDPTARSMGRLSLDPRRHLDPIGFLCMLLAGFGWAKPVPVNSRYFKNPRRDMALTSLAGPLSNLLLGFIFMLLLRFVGYDLLLMRVTYTSSFATRVAYYLLVFFFYGVQLNVTLAVFNLLPIPPLDGSRLLSMLLPPHLYYKLMRYEQYIVIAVMLLLLLGPLSSLIQVVVRLVMQLMFRLVGCPDIFGLF